MIILIRHATPQIDYSTCDCKTAQHRLQSYNKTTCVDENEIREFRETSIYQYIKMANPVVYSSPIGRAEKTCQVLFSNVDNYVIENDLKEVDLEIFSIPFIRINIKKWFALSRLAWILGIGKEKEKVQHAIKRSIRMCTLIENNKNIAIVSHGFFIYYLKKQLKKKYYKNTKFYRNGCFTLEIWEK